MQGFWVRPANVSRATRRSLANLQPSHSSIPRDLTPRDNTPSPWHTASPVGCTTQRQWMGLHVRVPWAGGGGRWVEVLTATYARLRKPRRRRGCPETRGRPTAALRLSGSKSSSCHSVELQGIRSVAQQHAGWSVRLGLRPLFTVDAAAARHCAGASERPRAFVRHSEARRQRGPRVQVGAAMCI